MKSFRPILMTSISISYLSCLKIDIVAKFSCLNMLRSDFYFFPKEIIAEVGIGELQSNFRGTNKSSI